MKLDETNPEPAAPDEPPAPDAAFWEKALRDPHQKNLIFNEIAKIREEDAKKLLIDDYITYDYAKARRAAQMKFLKEQNEAVREIKISAKPLDLSKPLDFGKVLRKIRKERKISQSQVAGFLQRCGLDYHSHKVISKWETNTSEPHLTELVALSVLFGVNLITATMQEAQKEGREIVPC